MEPIIGIDLGTTNSVVATVEEGVPVVIKGRSGYSLLPSIVALSKSGKRLVGHLAKRQAVTNPTHTIHASKRLIGRPWSSPLRAQAQQKVSYQLVEGPHDDVRVRLGEESLALAEIAAMILTELKLDAEKYFGQPVTKAVITVPAYFNDNQRQATRDAGRIAGLDVLRIINEPTAAALAYGFGRTVDKKVLVFDLGGGTFDVSVLDIANGVFDVIATGGDTYLGGEDFDNRLLDALASKFEGEHGIDLRQDPMALQRLRDAAEKSKVELSSALTSEVSLPFIHSGPGGGLHLQATLTREEFEALTSELVERCRSICLSVLEEAGLKPRDIDEVVLVGGMTRVPRLQKEVQALFGREPSKSVHPDEVVALGAAIQASALAHDPSDMLLLDVTPLSLGISIVGGLFQVLIPRNTTVPSTATHLFTTVRDNQTSAKIMVLQGESPVASENELLGEFMLTGLESAMRGEVEIEVVFDISADGIVSVSARDTKTGQRQSITVTATSGLTEEEVRAMVEESVDYQLAQRVDEQFEAVKREVEGLVREVNGLFEPVRAAVKGSDYGEDALSKAAGVVERAKAALAARDTAALKALKESLERTLQLFRGVLAKGGGGK